MFVSEHFDGVPWLERVYQAGSLWDAYEMGAPVDVHCYTPAEFERKREGAARRARDGRARPRAAPRLRVAPEEGQSLFRFGVRELTAPGRDGWGAPAPPLFVQVPRR